MAEQRRVPVVAQDGSLAPRSIYKKVTENTINAQKVSWFGPVSHAVEGSYIHAVLTGDTTLTLTSTVIGMDLTLYIEPRGRILTLPDGVQVYGSVPRTVRLLRTAGGWVTESVSGMVTPAPPTWVDSSRSVRVPSTEGIAYLMDTGGDVSNRTVSIPAETVRSTLRAEALPGYALTPSVPSQWTHDWPPGWLPFVTDTVMARTRTYSVEGISYVADVFLKEDYTREGAIFVQYGNWDANNDKVFIAAYGVDTKREYLLWKNFPRGASDEETFASAYYSEATGAPLLSSDRTLYVPHIDGLGYWEGCGFAYSKDAAGNYKSGWKNVRLPGQALHVFKMIETSEGLWASGSSIYEDQKSAGATLWFRPKGASDDTGWQVRWREPVKPADSMASYFGRYYNMKDTGSGVYVEALDGFAVAGSRVARIFTAATQNNNPAFDSNFRALEYATKTVTAGGHNYTITPDGVLRRQYK